MPPMIYVTAADLEDSFWQNLPDFNNLPIDYCVSRFDGGLF